MSEETASVCVANIGLAGRRRRTGMGVVAILFSVGLLAWLITSRAPWYERLLVFAPAGGAALALLQVSRNTCVGVARLGVRENEDLSYTPVEKDIADASRRVAATIWRDTVLLALAGAAVSVLTALVR